MSGVQPGSASIEAHAMMTPRESQILACCRGARPYHRHPRRYSA